MKAGNPKLAFDWANDRPAAVAEIKAALAAAQGNVCGAAEALKIHRRTLYRYFDEEPGLAPVHEPGDGPPQRRTRALP